MDSYEQCLLQVKSQTCYRAPQERDLETPFHTTYWRCRCRTTDRPPAKAISAQSQAKVALHRGKGERHFSLLPTLQPQGSRRDN